MVEVNLLASLPKTRRNIVARQQGKNSEIVRIAKQFGSEYFDGPRNYGYGGYRYDGRWVPVAKDIIKYYDLKPGDRVLDIGCAKGFLVKDLLTCCPGLEAFGLDISKYAVKNADMDVIGRLQVGNIVDLPFADKSFDCVLAINIVHNLSREMAVVALREIERVSKGRSFVQVDSYLTEEQRELFADWVLTAEFHGYPQEWLQVFQEAGYTGDYYWTIVE